MQPDWTAIVVCLITVVAQLLVAAYVYGKLADRVKTHDGRILKLEDKADNHGERIAKLEVFRMHGD